MFFVYVIENSDSHKIYVGWTTNLEVRLARHNGILPVKIKSYTHKQKKSGVWSFIYIEKHFSQKHAMQREKQLKSSRGREFLKHYRTQ